MSEEEANSAAYRYVEDTLWAFSFSFLKEWFVIDGDTAGEVHTAIAEKCEDGNEAMKQMVNWSENSNDIVSAAIESDGKGHFLSGYDGNEVEFSSEGIDVLLYRTN